MGKRILGVGSGVGNQTRYFADRERVVASDIEAHYLRELRRRFEDKAHVLVASFHFPLSNADRADLQGERIDSIVCMNVLEHIEHDRETLTDFASVLQPGGHMLLLVPAMPALYGTLDKALLHFRRYDKAMLRAIVPQELRVRRMQYLDSVGMLASLANKLLLRSDSPSPGQIRFWVSVMVRVPAGRSTDRIPAGQEHRLHSGKAMNCLNQINTREKFNNYINWFFKNLFLDPQCL